MIKIGVLVAGLYGVSFLSGYKPGSLPLPGESKTKTEMSMKNKDKEHKQGSQGVTVVKKMGIAQTITGNIWSFIYGW